MKKYIKPQLLTVAIETETMLSGSGERTINLYDTSVNPNQSLSKRASDLWLDDEEE